MKSCLNKKADMVKAKIEQGNSWYVADQFAEQLGKPGSRAIIERRWKYFGDIFLHYLKNRLSHGSIGPLRYLDAGCGDGINLQWAASFFQKHGIDAKITALDYNSIRVSRVKEKQLAEDTYVASLREMPFSDSTFDIVLCNHTLEHIAQYPQALAEIMRVLKPGGLLLVGVPNEGCFLGWLRNRVIQRSILNKTDHVNFFTSKTLKEALLDAGFIVVQVYREGFFSPHTWVHYALTYIAWGRGLLSMLGRALPSQCADLIVYAIKPITANTMK